MSKDKKIYWTVTIIAMALIVLPSYFAPREYLVETIRRMEFPSYFGLEVRYSKDCWCSNYSYSCNSFDV